MKQDLHAEVTARIVAQLETGVRPWMCPWTTGESVAGRPLRATGEPYRGINTLILWEASLIHGYHAPTWNIAPQAEFLEGRPVTLRLTAGQVADCTEAQVLIDNLREGDILLADKGYDSNAIRATAAERKAWANILPKTNRKGSFAFSCWVYRQRNLVERFFSRIKQFRGIATRYDKRPENSLAAVKLVAARIWCLSL